MQRADRKSIDQASHASIRWHAKPFEIPKPKSKFVLGICWIRKKQRNPNGCLEQKLFDALGLATPRFHAAFSAGFLDAGCCLFRSQSIDRVHGRCAPRGQVTRQPGDGEDARGGDNIGPRVHGAHVEEDRRHQAHRSKRYSHADGHADSASRRPWRTNSEVSACLCAPIAMRIPISRVRCETA